MIAMERSNFEKLEERINELLKACEVLESENRRLKEQYGLKELEVEGLKKRLAKIEREKGLVREKVEGLIDRLDGLMQNA